MIIAARHRLCRESAPGAAPRSTAPWPLAPPSLPRSRGCCPPGGGTHVHLPHVGPRRLVDDALHARLSRDIGAEMGMPVLLALLHQDLGPEDAAALAAARMFISPMSTHAVLWTMRSMPGSAVTSAPRRACQSFWRYWVQKDRRPLVVAQLEDLEQEAAKAVVQPAEQPFVEDEDLEGPYFLTAFATPPGRSCASFQASLRSGHLM